MTTQKPMTKHSLIRKIYLYVATLIGLSVFLIGAGNLIDLGLKTYIFTQAEQEDAYYLKRPMVEESLYSKIGNEDIQKLELTESEQKLLKQSLQDYDQWVQDGKNLDPLKSTHQRRAANGIAMVLIGLPMYLAHLMIIRKEKQ
ncbi:hypothetical protein COT97_04635 [Candidatus Falkowbacteria bacterium CG10_big_fil_rev_8_21_14_0_10_39_11]|uniref:DUF5671 domain-containing protein n=1 Tax=Candidatus Falkowbacteria bacterium CG10_big_fil_rev_8_21_14_0_10_39_11 TaxID=1974565 RepID=A0A2H0V406_9BACT|nr:MAG: hypothetical protein COT97_04635 [Candidatus Falkowbacteria bacterium CG10_big_fil_rev_8_21_14_0_10_39_11]